MRRDREPDAAFCKGAHHRYTALPRVSGNRKDGARRLRGGAKAAAGTLWSLRDLQVGIG